MRSTSTEAERILVVEDDSTLRGELVDALRGNGFAPLPCATLREAETLLRQEFDLLLLDLWLPDGDGLDLCRQIRFDGNTTPVLVLTSRDDSEHVVRGLDVGADDYVTKPVKLPELLARVRSVLRRSTPTRGRPWLSAGPISVNVESRRAWLDGNEISLPPREFDLLSLFLRHPGRTWTRRQLLERVWGPKFDGEDRTVDLNIARLRSAIEANPRAPRWIETVWRVGYRLRDQAE